MSDQDKPKNILRRKPKTGYTTLSNEIIEDRELSYRARGVALLLLSKPDDWEISIQYLVEMGTEGRDAVRKAMHELSDRGYMKRERAQGEGGARVTVTLIADYPAFINDGTPESRRHGYDADRPTENPTDGKPGSRKTDPLENRPTENQEVILKTDLPTPDLPTTEETLPNTDVGSGASSTPSVSGSVGAPAAQNDDKHGAVGEGDAAAEDDAATGRYGLDGLSGECRRAAVRFMAIVGRNYLTEGEYHVFWSEGQLGAKAVKPHDHDWLLGNIERDLAAGKLDKYGDDLGPVLKWRYNDKHKRDGEKRADGKKPKAPAVRRRLGETDSAERRKEYLPQ